MSHRELRIDLFARRGQWGQFPPVADRIDATGDCWQWLGAPNTDGYGRVRYKGGQFAAHRLVWEALVGPIPEGFTLDHLCLNKLCVNPDHLEVTTNRENILRGHGHAGRNARKVRCVRGHPLSSSNLYISPVGKRACRTCRRAADRRRRTRGGLRSA